MSRLVVLALLSAVAFVVLAVVAARVPYFEIDLQLARAIQSVRSPVIDQVALAISWPGFPPQSNVIFGTLVLLLAALRRFVAAFWQVVAAAVSAALWFAITPLVNRPRPTSDLVYVSEEIPFGSFPSGHALNLTAGFGFVWFLAITLLPGSPGRTAIMWLMPMYLVLLGFARVYVGQHWPSDVLGGYLLGVSCLCVCILGYLVSARIIASLARRRRHNSAVQSAAP